MSTENTRQRFKDAVGILVDEPGDIKQRLMIAYISQLSHVNAKRDLPEHMVSALEGIRFTLTIDEVEGDRGTVSKELKKLSDDEASQLARQVFEMFLELHGIEHVVPNA